MGFRFFARKNVSYSLKFSTTGKNKLLTMLM